MSRCSNRNRASQMIFAQPRVELLPRVQNARDRSAGGEAEGVAKGVVVVAIRDRSGGISHQARAALAVERQDKPAFRLILGRARDRRRCNSS